MLGCKNKVYCSELLLLSGRCKNTYSNKRRIHGTVFQLYSPSYEFVMQSFLLLRQPTHHLVSML